MDWIRGERLGHGSFATVSLAVPRSSRNSPLMAVKSCGVSHASSLMDEKLILEELRHCPQVIKCYGDSFSCENGERLYNVLLEYAPGGALSDKLKNSETPRFPESEARQYTKALLKGLNYIHKSGYVHCDIKLQNILLSSDGDVKIADFGLARRSVKDGVVSGCELRGTPMYMSPEILNGGDQNAPADVWALGCVVLEMVTGSPPWKCSEAAELLVRIGVGGEAPEIPAGLSVEGQDFLERCFVKDPSERWTAEMLLSHPFVSCTQDCSDNSDSAFVVLKGHENSNSSTSTSPRCPFDFPEWESCTTASLHSPVESGSWFTGEPDWTSESWSTTAAERLSGLVGERGPPNWSVSEDWVTVR